MSKHRLIQPLDLSRTSRLVLRLRVLLLLAVVSLNLASRFYPAAFAALRPQSPSPIAMVSAASYETSAVTPDSIVSIFGANLSAQTEVLSTSILPTTLADRRVEINGQIAQLFFVSPGQINLLIPPGVTSGATANIIVRAGNGTVTGSGTAQINQAGPAIFTANADGQGVPAAQLVRVKTNNDQLVEPLAQFNASTQKFFTKPIDLGPTGERVFLILFLSGIRRANDPNNDGNLTENVRVVLGGTEIVPDYAGIQPGFAGLDQINVEIPRSLIGRGKVNLTVSVNGFGSSNIGEIEIAGAAGAAPPVVSGFSSANVLAGEMLTINGSGFSTNAADNLVRIAGTEAEMVTASSTQLSVAVPFGVETGMVTVQTPQGEGSSNSALQVRTSISGFVEDTTRQPMAGVTVKLTSGTPITTTTNAEGLFVIPDVQAGPALVEIDGSMLTSPPYPKMTLKTVVTANRDNQFSQPVAMQQATGPGLPVGTGGGSPADSSEEINASITVDNVTLDVPAGAATFPGGATGGNIFLTVIEQSRTPVGLPAGHFSSVIAQITPFGVTLNPGGKLTFPNSDNLPAGTQARLFRFDQSDGSPTIGDFIDVGVATVSADGQRIETAAGAITQTGIYFASVLRQTTTVIGRVVESGSLTPVRRALVRARGREAFTDGNGGFILRGVPVRPGDQLSVDVSYVRPNGRIDRKQSNSVNVVVGGLTIITPQIELPSPTSNRAPVLLAPFKLTVNEGELTTVRFAAFDPDRNQTMSVSVFGASFVSQSRDTGVFYSLNLFPGFNAAGTYTLDLVANDGQGTSTIRRIALTVTDVNRAPSLTNPGNRTLSENATINFTLAGSDPDTGQTLAYSLASPLTGATINAATGAFSYTAPFSIASQTQPVINLNVTFVVTDNGTPARTASQTITITVNNVNRPPQAGSQNINLAEDTPTPITLQAIDADNDPLIWTITEPPRNGVLTGTAPNVTYTPNANFFGNDSFKFRVNDGLANSNEPIMTLSVSSVNDVPVLTVPGAQTVSEGQTLRFNVSATDADAGQTLALSVTGFPSGSSFVVNQDNTANFSWTPNLTQAGTYVVTFRATDDGNPAQSDTKTVTINVNDFVHDLSVDPENFTVFGDKATIASPPDTGDAVGTSVAVGDLNGDGNHDLVVGAPTANGSSGGINNGRVYVFFGKLPNGLVDLQQSNADATLIGETAGDQLGSSLAIGDINGDGNNDLVIGAAEADLIDASSGRTLRTDSGKAYAVFGKLTAGTFAINQAAGLTIVGSANGDRLGAEVAVGGVINKGTPADLIVGAPQFDPPAVTASLTDAGRAYLFAGGSDLSGTIDLASKGATFTVTGSAADMRTGSVLAVGDVNGDGFADLAVGAPLFNSQTRRGAVYLVFGAASLSGDRSFGSQSSDLSVVGKDSGDRLGSSLAIGDVNGDGRGDLLMGAATSSGLDNASDNAGEVHIVFGTTSLKGLLDLSQQNADVTIYGAGNGRAAFPGLGTGLATGDFSGDGIADFAIGAPGVVSGVPRTDCGAVYVFFGAKTLASGTTVDLAKGSAPLTIYGADTNDLIGGTGLAFGELNGAAPGDLVLGVSRAASFANQRTGAGEVRVLFGRTR